MKKILLATSNAHKVEEFKEILKNFDLEIVSLKDLNNTAEAVEDGTTFKENSIIKAKFYHDLYKIPTISDDSGVSIDFLDGAPGIYSARFLPELSYPEKHRYIIDKMKDEKENRGAHYTCVITYVDDDTCESFEGFLYGEVATEPKGDGGFGYDPMFYLSEYGMTLAELGTEKKNAISHRKEASDKLVAYFEKNL